MTRTVKLTKLVTIMAFCAACVSHQEGEFYDCDANRPEVSITSITDPTTCDSNNGQIVAAGTAGEEPYQFKLNTGTYQASGTFEGLGGGTYTVTIKDAKGCENSTEATLTVAGSDLAATYETEPDSECLSDNGTITIAASGTNTPFQYKLDNGSFGTDNTFADLQNGSHTITVRDALSCTITVSATVARGETGVSYQNDIKPIISANCAITGCHVSGSQSPNLSVLANVQSNASRIKTRTGNRTMPMGGSLTQTQINLIACWVDDGAKNN